MSVIVDLKVACYSTFYFAQRNCQHVDGNHSNLLGSLQLGNSLVY